MEAYETPVPAWQFVWALAVRVRQAFVVAHLTRLTSHSSPSLPLRDRVRKWDTRLAHTVSILPPASSS